MMVMMTRWKLHRTGEEEVKFTKKEKKSKERERGNYEATL